jgi:phage FluMu protein gp41
VHGPSHFDAKIAVERFKRYNFPGADQLLANPIQAGGETLCCDIHKLANVIGIKGRIA